MTRSTALMLAVSESTSLTQRASSDVYGNPNFLTEDFEKFKYNNFLQMQAQFFPKMQAILEEEELL